MKIAVPLVEGTLAMHFGHCDTFAIMDVDDQGKVVSRDDKSPPPHEPGILPAWLHQLGITYIIAGGMGSRAQNLFGEKGIRVIVGAPFDTPEALAVACFKGNLTSGNNICGH